VLLTYSQRAQLTQRRRATHHSQPSLSGTVRGEPWKRLLHFFLDGD
jgi:hypothetical protein